VEGHLAAIDANGYGVVYTIKRGSSVNYLSVVILLTLLGLLAVGGVGLLVRARRLRVKGVK
jgi:hypothetical protein